MATLEILVGDHPPKTFEIVRRETVVGRHPQCDIVLPDTTVSRQHARVLCEKDGYYVEDLDSQHGTRLNDQALVSREKLSDLDQIRVRSALIKFHEKSSGHIFGDDILNERPSTILSKKDASSLLERIGSENAEEKLRALLEITRTLGTTLDLQQIFPQILDRVFVIFPQATRGAVVLAESLEDRIKPHAIKVKNEGSDEVRPISRTIANRVIRHAEAILSSDAAEDSRFDKSDSIANLRIRSIMCAPLVATSKSPLGMIQIETDARPSFMEEDLEVLMNVANLVGQIIDHSRLHETQLQFDRRARDIDVARQVQLHFLPEERPQIPGYQVFDYYVAAEGVGGDYFSYIEMPDGKHALAIGDVAGKGVSAALLMARLCSDVRYCLLTNPDPASAVEQLNVQISKAVVMGGFITFCMVIVDPATHEISVVNAGHMPPLCRRAATGKVEAIGRDVSSPPLGVRAERPFEAATTKLEPGDTLFLYTDGVSEAANRQRDLLGNTRVQEIVSEVIGAESTVQKVLEQVNLFTSGTSQNDDICMVCLGRDGQ